MTIADMAHIIAASSEGPRGADTLTENERAQFENLLLLCPRCHRRIDQAPEQYSTDQLRQWKADLQRRVTDAVAVAKLETRAKLRGMLVPLLRRNHAVWLTYGPDTRSPSDPAGDSADIWQRKVREELLPNDLLILAVLDTNVDLLNTGELITLEQFRAHVDDLTARHLHGVIEVGSSRFPEDMNRIISDDETNEF